MSDDELMVLAGVFPPVSHDDWIGAVDKILAGRPFEKVLRSTTADGIVVEPLYTRDDEHPVAQFPGEPTHRRASRVTGSIEGWDIRQRHALAETTDRLNHEILTDLARGVTSIELVTDGLTDAAMWHHALDGVLLDLAPVALRSSDSGLGAAAAFLDLVERRGIPAASLVADLGLDPIGSLARRGAIERPIDDALDAVAGLATPLARSHPQARAVRADGSVYAEAGASPGLELAATVATGVAYLRALTGAGMDEAAALGQVLLTVTVGTDQFGDIAKIRALRIMWARVGEAIGHPDHDPTVQAVTSAATLTRRDPWVNMLRTTIGCFAAAVGGADIVTVTPFDAQLGAPDDLGLRIARNTQLALMEESGIHRVIDPAGGSWYVERLTDQLAGVAWSAFQDIERSGGIVAALRSGRLQQLVAEQWQDTARAVATRRRPLTGVSEFPDLDERPLARPAPPEPGAASAPEVEALPVRRLAAGFEDLRTLADMAADRPCVFLANLGPVATHTARASWARNAFEAGGIRAVGDQGYDDPGTLAEAFAASGCSLAVLCSSDARYGTDAAAAAAALHQAGAARVYMAGNPGDQRAVYEGAGVDEFIHVGCDILDTLERAHELLAGTTVGARS